MEELDMSKSVAFCPYSIPNAVFAAELFNVVGVDPSWKSINQLQDEFLATYPTYRRMFNSSVKPGELESFASPSLKDVVKWLKDRGVESQLDEMGGDDCALVSYFKLLLKWISPGSETTVSYRRQNYPAFTLPYDVALFEQRVHPNPIVAIETSNGDTVYMTVYDTPITDEFFLTESIDYLRNTIKRTYQTARVTAPMVDLKLRGDINWLIGMNTMSSNNSWGGGKRVKVTQAKRATSMSMDQHGVKAVEVAEVIVTREAFVLPPVQVVIDRPFLFWVQRGELEKVAPLFCAYVDPTDWKRPAKTS